MNALRTRLAMPVLGAALLLTGCSETDAADDAADDSRSTAPSSSAPPTPTPSSSAAASDSATPSEEPEPEGQRLEVTIDGDDVSPNAEELQLTSGEPLTLVFTSDRAGELHVHAKPEQYVDFTEGTSEAELVIDTPGSVAVEEHETGIVIAQIQVRP